MRTKLFALVLLVRILMTSCATATTQAPAPTPVPPTPETIIVTSAPQTIVETVISEVVVTAPPSPNPEAVIQGVEANAEIGFWTFWLSPTFDQYIKDTIARFNQAYPGVTVNWEDHQATFQDDLKNAFAAGNAPDVINLSVGEGWVSDYASQGLLLPLDDQVPQRVKDLYFPGLWDEQLMHGVNYQFPWYNFVAIELINTQLYTGVPQTDANGNV